MIGLIVVCDKTRPLDNRLKIGEKYKVVEVARSKYNDIYYVVITDKGNRIGYLSKSYFKPLAEVREQKLKEIGI
jgi:hypothetical protein